MMITNWFKIKKMELEVKLAFYSAITGILKEQADIIQLISNLYTSLKDTPPESLQKMLLEAIAGFAHEQAVKQRTQN